MRTLTTRSTFRPPPFVSAEKELGYPLPTNSFHTSYHTPAPSHLSQYTPAPSHLTHYTPSPTQSHVYKTSYDTPSPFLSSLSDDISTVLEITSFRDGGGGGEGEGSGKQTLDSSQGGGESWVSGSNFTDINLTTSLFSSAVTSSSSESGFLNYTQFPAGYPSGYTWLHIILASVAVSVIILIIVVGNFMVMWAIVRDKNLKGTQNYFIGSLALADFLLGLLIVPFSMANELMGYWHFGSVLCEVWKALDVLLCTASITSLCLISLDRYWSITKAIHYSRQRTPKRAAIMIFIVWFASAAICIPPLIGWNQPAPENTDWPVCTLSEDIGYVLYSSMGSFYIPAFIMVFVYFKIYQAAKARARKNVSKTPRSAMSEKSEQKHSTESSGTDHTHHQHYQDDESTCQLEDPPQQQHQTLEQQLLLRQQQCKQQVGMFPERLNYDERGDERKGEIRESHLKVHPLQSSSVDEADMEEIALTPAAVTPADDEEGEDLEDFAGGCLIEEGARRSSHCRCANEILSDSLTATGVTSEEDDDLDLGTTLEIRTRSLSLPCRTGSALRSDELTRLIGATTTDSDSCDALGPSSIGPAALNHMDLGRFSYSMPTTTTTDTDSSLDLFVVPPPPPPPPPPQRQQQLVTFDAAGTGCAGSGGSLNKNNNSQGSLAVSQGSGTGSMARGGSGFMAVAGASANSLTVSGGGGSTGATAGGLDSTISTPVRDESTMSLTGAAFDGAGDYNGGNVNGCGGDDPGGGNGNGSVIQQFRIMEPKQNGSVGGGGSGFNSPLHKHVHQDAMSTDSQTASGLFGSLRRQLFPTHHNNGKVGERQQRKAPTPKKKKKTHNNKTKTSKNGGSDNKGAPDLFSADRHKRKLAKARERRATLVLGLVMAAFILCWLPFFLLYVASAFCMGCIPPMVFTVFFWIGYCNSALNPIIYTVFNRDFRRAFARMIFGRRRFGRR